MGRLLKFYIFQKVEAWDSDATCPSLKSDDGCLHMDEKKKTVGVLTLGRSAVSPVRCKSWRNASATKQLQLTGGSFRLACWVAGYVLSHGLLQSQPQNSDL